MVERVDDFLSAETEGQSWKEEEESEKTYHAYTPYSSDIGSPCGSWNASIG